MVNVKESQLVGTVLSKRFTIGRLIGRGACGRVYKVVDSQRKDKPLVIKISPDITLIYKEINAIFAVSERIHNTSVNGAVIRQQAPKIYSYGLINVLDDRGAKCQVADPSEQAKNNSSDTESSCQDDIGTHHAYYIMPRYGNNLEDSLSIYGHSISKESVYNLGI